MDQPSSVKDHLFLTLRGKQDSPQWKVRLPRPVLPFLILIQTDGSDAERDILSAEFTLVLVGRRFEIKIHLFPDEQIPCGFEAVRPELLPD